MSYREEVYKVVDRYFMEIIMPYGNLNKAANQYAKKMMPFQRKDFSGYIQDYRNFAAASKILTMDDIPVPEDDAYAREMVEAFAQSRTTFQRLCGRNVTLLEFYQRKADKQKVTMEELRDVTAALQMTMNSAMRDIDRLELAYKEMKATEDEAFAAAYAQEKAKKAEVQEQIDEAVAKKKAKIQAKIDKKEARQDKKRGPKEPSRSFEQADADDYEDIEDID